MTRASKAVDMVEGHVIVMDMGLESKPTRNEAMTSLVSAVETAVVKQSNKSIELLLLPDVLFFLPFDVLCSLPQVCLAFSKATQGQDDVYGYWNALAHACSRAKGLYLPVDRIFGKAAFFTEVWPLRTKWEVVNVEQGIERTSAAANTFKIQVASRSRPGPQPKDSLNLPLHQFLKIKRRQQRENADQQGKPLVGDTPPEEFMDPILNSLLKDPVLLKTSGRVVSRSVAVQSILRGGRDPFSNRKLTHAQLEDLPELQARIEQYKLEQAKRDDVSLDRKEIMKFVEGSAIDPDILAALVEADRIASASDRATSDALEEQNRGGNRGRGIGERGIGESGRSGADGETGPETDPVTGQQLNTDVDNSSGDADGSGTAEAAGEVGSDSRFNDSGASASRWRTETRETARVVDVNSQNKTVAMHVPGAGIRPFHFNKVFPGLCEQKQVYEESVQDLVLNTLNGFNTCLLCYGQTGSGKTHTMFGPEGALDKDIDDDMGPDEHAGAVVRVCMELIRAKKHMARLGVTVQVSAKMVEIYNEQVSDLLSGNAAQVSRSNGEVVGAINVPLSHMVEILTFLKEGQGRKRFAATAMNERSSRSHTAIILTVKQSLPDKDAMVTSQCTLVDLAGSERIKKSKVTGARATEAIGINSSLLVLGKVIASLVESKKHVPYFESKLTTMLKGAFGGNCRTSVIIASRMEAANGDETLQSLRFGERCGLISNSTLQAATSASSALKAMDEAIEKVKVQLEGLEARNKVQLAKKVQLGLTDLLTKRQTIAIAAGKEMQQKQSKNTHNQPMQQRLQQATAE